MRLPLDVSRDVTAIRLKDAPRRAAAGPNGQDTDCQTGGSQVAHEVLAARSAGRLMAIVMRIHPDPHSPHNRGGNRELASQAHNRPDSSGRARLTRMCSIPTTSR